MKRSLILGLLLSSTMLAACTSATSTGGNASTGGNTSTGTQNSTSTGGNTSVGGTSQSSSSTQTGPTENLGISLEELKSKNIEVTFWHTMGSANMEILNQMIAEFNKIYPNITITHAAQGGYGDLREKILTSIPAETTPVMAYAYPDHVAEYIDAGAAVRLNDYVNDPVIGFNANDGVSTDANDGVDDYVPGFWSEGASYDNNGSVYSVPYTKSTEVLFMNETWMVNHGLVDSEGKAIVPTKWENEADPNDLTAMINLCRAIKKIDSSITPLGYDSDDNLYITLSAQYGIPYTSISEVNGSIVGSNDFANTDALALVKKVKGWFDEGLIVTKGTLPNNTYTSTKFTEQSLIMSVGSTGGTKYNIPAVSDGEYEFNVEVCALPQADSENPAVISQGPSITFLQNSKIDKYQTAAAWVFYKFITNTRNTAVWAISTGYEPVRISAYNSAIYQEHLTTTDSKGQLDLFQKVANLTVKVTDWYFTSPAFKGSATTRDQVGAIISTVCLNDLSNMTEAEKDSYITGVFYIAWTEANLAKG